MSDRLWLLRHGDTEWTEAERHTGRRDVRLSDNGRQQARAVARLLADQQFSKVLVSPQSRALETCQLAGFAEQATKSELLVEWDYGDYEGLTDEQTREKAPGWDLFRDGCPGGESPEEVGARVDKLLDLVAREDGSCLMVGHGKTLRALGARWLNGEVAFGAMLAMDPAAICVLEHSNGQPLIRAWNRTPQRLSALSIDPSLR